MKKALWCSDALMLVRLILVWVPRSRSALYKRVLMSAERLNPHLYGQTIPLLPSCFCTSVIIILPVTRLKSRTWYSKFDNEPASDTDIETERASVLIYGTSPSSYVKIFLVSSNLHQFTAPDMMYSARWLILLVPLCQVPQQSCRQWEHMYTRQNHVHGYVNIYLGSAAPERGSSLRPSAGQVSYDSERIIM
jgi:hypothetical protein